MMVKLRHVAIFMMAMPFQVSATELFELSLEELLNVEVTSVSKQRQALSDSPAAIYVISNEDLNRSGVTSIPEALRSVPGLHVAQIDSQKWAISSRGFNGRYNNKLLVLMDGRTLYSPEFSGVYWEVQDTLITDIDRIEIIRGPSAAIWGANAVNGVINIITKHTSQTKGSYAELGTGDYEKGFGGVRYGGSLTNNTTARAYIKGFNRDSLQYQKNDIGSQQQHLLNGVDLKNKWSHHQLGGRLDSKLSKSSEITISSDVYQSRMQHVGHVATLATSAPQHREYFSDKFDADGWNLLAKYKQVKSPNSSYTIQAYYDYANRDDTIFGFETRTFDLDFQHQFLAGQRHNIIWGMGYRHIKDIISPHATITSPSRSDKAQLSSAFLRDEISLVDNALWLSLAARLEHNSYTGIEWQPNARLSWNLDDQHKLWTSVAYAVRTPSRAENDIKIHNITYPGGITPNIPKPIPVTVAGSKDYDSETLLAYEFGYRFSGASPFIFDSTIFYNDYDKLRGIKRPNPANPTASVFDNSQDGHSYGLELSNQWLIAERFKLKLNYSYIKSEFSLQQTQNVAAPKNMVSLHADWEFDKNLEFHATWRYVGTTRIIDTLDLTQNVVYKKMASFKGVDMGVNWKINPNIVLSAYGKNLFYGAHIEYEAEQFRIPYRVEPSFFTKVSFSY